MWWSRKHRCDPAIFEDIAKLRRQIESLELEWVNFYDKAKRMMGRIAKRAEVVESAEAPQSDGAPSSTQPLRNSMGLTTRQVEIQQQILRRRGNSGVM